MVLVVLCPYGIITIPILAIVRKTFMLCPQPGLLAKSLCSAAASVVGLFNKSSCLAAALDVTTFITVLDMNLVTLCCAA